MPLLQIQPLKKRILLPPSLSIFSRILNPFNRLHILVCCAFFSLSFLGKTRRGKLSLDSRVRREDKRETERERKKVKSSARGSTILQWRERERSFLVDSGWSAIASVFPKTQKPSNLQGAGQSGVQSVALVPPPPKGEEATHQTSSPNDDENPGRSGGQVKVNTRKRNSTFFPVSRSMWVSFCVP